IRDGLVGGEFDTRAPFFAHNQKLIREIENLEHKSRRLDVLVDDDLIAAFYDRLLPADVCNGIAFEKWHKEATLKSPKLLYLNRDDLMRHEAAGITTELFPKMMMVAGVEMGLSFHFEPGAPRDGVTLSVPLYALNQIPAERCEWLVPGMLKEKVHLLLKSLPQKLRRNCVPLPDYAARFCERVQAAERFGKGSLIDAIIADIREQLRLAVMQADFKQETLPAHHFMNFKIIDEHGRQLEMGRNLSALQAEFGGQARQSFQKLAENTRIAASDAALARLVGGGAASPQSRSASTAGGTSASLPASGNTAVQTAAQLSSSSSSSSAIVEHSGLTAWSFGELPELLEIERGKQTLIGFPALVDKTTHCDLEVFDDPAEAARHHRIGLRRLFALQMKEQLKFVEKNIPGLQQMGMQFMSLGSQEELRDQIVASGLERAFLQAPLPVNAEQFAQRREQGKARLVLLINEIARLAGLILAEFHGLPKKLQGVKAHPAAVADIQSQLQGLVGKRFIADTPYENLTHLPRYLKAIVIRLDKLRADPVRDTRLTAEWSAVALPYQRALKDRNASTDPKMVEFRWLLEELRVSLFAQELRTPMPVSGKRLQKVWDALQR
ncbi:MAG: ATP-dependent helicase, partial [Mucilaginibacter sp.]|nr:ATP-dependent helicase [Mucilaginibacter sp.]